MKWEQAWERYRDARPREDIDRQAAFRAGWNNAWERGKDEGIAIGKDIGRAIGWDAAKRDTSKVLGTDQ